jgi:hypothetical protein
VAQIWMMSTWFLDDYFGPFPFSFVATSSVYCPVFSKLCKFHKKITIFLASSVDPPQINAGTVLWKITCITSSRIGLFSIFHLLFSIFYWVVGDGYSHRIWIAQWWTYNMKLSFGSSKRGIEICLMSMTFSSSYCSYI